MDDKMLIELQNMKEGVTRAIEWCHNLDKAIQKLESRLNSHFPPTWACPHCGRKVAQHAVKCTYCEKGFVAPVVG